jgi:hypothetical protein
MLLSLLWHVIIIYVQQDIIILAQDYTINEWSEGHPRNDSVVDCFCPELSELIG